MKYNLILNDNFIQKCKNVLLRTYFSLQKYKSNLFKCKFCFNIYDTNIEFFRLTIFVY